MSAVVHVVALTHSNGKSGGNAWFWDTTEAQDRYESDIDACGDTHKVELLRINITDGIDELVQEHIDNGLAEVMRHHDPSEPEVPEYTTLRYSTEDHNTLYIERTFGGEFWAYTVEKRHNNSWKVREQMNGEMIGRIYQDDATALLPSYSVELRADTDPVAHGASLQEAVEKLIGTVSGDFGEVK